MHFICLQIFKVKFFENSLWVKSLANKSNSQELPFLYFYQYDPKEVRVLTNVIFLVLGQQMIKNPLMLPGTIYFCIFVQPLWISLFLVFCLLITLQREFPVSNIIFVEYALQIKIKLSHFQEFTLEQVLKSFSGRNNSLEPHIFGSSNSLPYGLEESREL